ncbi:beta-lactamase family protein [bacterium]|nr:beta-lactamase family protein [bacterium]
MHSQFKHNFKWVIALALLILNCGCGGGHGLISDLTQARRLSDAVEFLRAKYDQPGLAAALISSAEIEQAVDGVRKYGETDRLTQNDFFHIGSNTKALSAVMLGRLVEAGQLSWTSRPVDCIAGLAELQDPGYATITLEQILSHAAGLPALDELEDLLLVPAFTGTPESQRQQFSLWVLNQPPAGPLGEYCYSNAGYVIAAVMAEQVTGKSWEELMDEWVYDPLGIEAWIGWPAENDSNQPWGHQEFDGVVEPHDPLLVEEQMPDWLTPAGDVSLRLEDYAKFVQYYLRALRGAETWIPQAMLDRLATTEQFYCLGWAVLPIDGERSYLHDGSAGTFYAYTTITPGADRAIVIITNAVIDDTDYAVLDLESWLYAQE